jgi:hypothetical protein
MDTKNRSKEIFLMCIIAGYAGSRRAAPILIEMLKKTEYIDGGLSTGIATIHEGKLHWRKVIGDVDELLRSTDAIDLPGTVVLIHSRTAGNYIEHAHPFLSADARGAFVLNGTFRDALCPEFFAAFDAAMTDLYRRGLPVRSGVVTDKPKWNLPLPDGRGFHPSEYYALTVGETMAAAKDGEEKQTMARAFRDTLGSIPADIIMLGVHERTPDTITVGTLSRPMFFGVGEGEVYLSTTPISFPDTFVNIPITLLPPTSVAQVTAGGVTLCSTTMDGVRVEQADARTKKLFYDRIKEILSAASEAHPKSIYDFPAYEEWRDAWHEPMVDSKFVSPTGCFKPYVALIYEILWGFYREGRLASRIIDQNGTLRVCFWLKGEK